MAGLISHRLSKSFLRPSLSISLRHRSSKPTKAQLIEIEIDSSSSSSPVRKLEDVIYNIIVRRSAPDWLPFMPGSSYWVPPRKKNGHAGLVDVIGSFNGNLNGNVNANLNGNMGGDVKTEEENLALNSVMGWPSSSFFFQGTAPARPLPVDIQVVEVKFQEDSDNESRSEDED